MHKSPVVNYLGVLRRQWWLIALTVAIGVGAAIGVSAVQEPTYRASLKIVVGQGGGVFQPQYGGAVQSFTQTMSSLLDSEVVGRRVTQNLGLQRTPRELLEGVSLSTRPESSVLEVSYDAESKSQAVKTLAEIGIVFTTLIERRLGRKTGGKAPESLDVTAKVFDPSYLEGQVSPKPARSAALAGILGLGLGLLFALLREGLDDRLRSPHEVEETFGVDVVGVLPKSMIGRPPPGLANQPASNDAQLAGANDLLRIGLGLQPEGDRGSMIFLTSAASGEGKTTVAANMAVALAMTGEDVICVDADANQPALHRYLGVKDYGGGGARAWDDLLDVNQFLSDVSLAWDNTDARFRETVSLYSSGATGSPGVSFQEGPNHHAGGQSGRLRMLLPSVVRSYAAQTDPAGNFVEGVSDLRQQSSFVIISGPPILSMGRTSLLTASDKVIMVTREGKTRRSMAERAKNALVGLGIRDFLVVVVDAEHRGTSYW